MYQFRHVINATLCCEVEVINRELWAFKVWCTRVDKFQGSALRFVRNHESDSIDEYFHCLSYFSKHQTMNIPIYATQFWQSKWVYSSTDASKDSIGKRNTHQNCRPIHGYIDRKVGLWQWSERVTQALCIDDERRALHTETW